MPENSTGWTDPTFEPDKQLWTIMQGCGNGLKPLAPEYTALSHKRASDLLFKLRPKVDKPICMVPTVPGHMSREAGHKALRQLFHDGGREDLLKHVDKVRKVDVRLMAHIGFEGLEEQRRLDAWQRTNERRAQQGLEPLPYRKSEKAEPVVDTDRKGHIVIRLGGAR